MPFSIIPIAAVQHIHRPTPDHNNMGEEKALTELLSDCDEMMLTSHEAVMEEIGMRLDSTADEKEAGKILKDAMATLPYAVTRPHLALMIGHGVHPEFLRARVDYFRGDNWKTDYHNFKETDEKHYDDGNYSTVMNKWDEKLESIESVENKLVRMILPRMEMWIHS